MNQISKKKSIVIFLTIGLSLTLLVYFSSTNQDSGLFVTNTSNFNSNQAQAIIESCKTDMHCAMEKLDEVSKTSSKDEVVSVFATLITSYDKQLPCHETGHHLGMWFYGYMGNLTESLQYAEQQCGGAVYHGIIQNHLLTKKFQGVLPVNIPISDICQTRSENHLSIQEWQCIHGVGHGLSNLYDYDVFSALERCEEFLPGLQQISCSKGIFMQNVVEFFETKGGFFDEKNVFSPCSGVDEKYMPQCYHYHTTYFLINSNGHVKTAFDLCDKITPKEMVRYCYYGMGRQMSANIENSVERAVSLCTVGANPQYHSDCLSGMVMTMVNVNDNPSVGFEFCKLLPTQYKKDCYESLGKWVLMINPSKEFREQQCSKADTKENSNICINANFDGIKLL